MLNFLRNFFPKSTSIEVSVKARHIRKGEKTSPLFCALALAVKDIYPRDIVWVTPPYVKIMSSNEPHKLKHKFKASRKMKNFMLDFDYGASIYPCTLKMKEQK
jgi:hypothetical protein